MRFSSLTIFGIFFGTLFNPSHVAIAQTSETFKPVILTQDRVPTQMTPERLDTLIREEATEVRSQGDRWQFTLENQSTIVIVNEQRDRMRIFTRVVPIDRLTPEQVGNVLVANFHTALDARYAIADGSLVSTFIHPLSSLQERDFRSALYQVVRLADNFGSSYSSEGLIFTPNEQPYGNQEPEREVNPEI